MMRDNFEYDLVRFNWKNAVDTLYIERMYRHKKYFPSIALNIPLTTGRIMMDISDCPYIMAVHGDALKNWRGNPTPVASVEKLTDFISFLDRIKIKYLLEQMDGKLVLAGGSIWRGLIGERRFIFFNRTGNKLDDYDFDFFIIADNAIEAEKTLQKALMILDRILQDEPEDLTEEKDEKEEKKEKEKEKERMFIIRHKNVTNAYFKDTLFQFIHRVYPTPASVIYGFDLPCSRFYTTNGTDFYTTPLGNLVANTGVCPIDPERASPSFFPRMAKYSGLGVTMLLVGCSYEKVIKKGRSNKKDMYYEFWLDDDRTVLKSDGGNIFEFYNTVNEKNTHSDYLKHQNLHKESRSKGLSLYRNVSTIMNLSRTVKDTTVKDTKKNNIIWTGTVDTIFPSKPSDFKIFNGTVEDIVRMYSNIMPVERSGFTLYDKMRRYLTTNSFKTTYIFEHNPWLQIKMRKGITISKRKIGENDIELHRFLLPNGKPLIHKLAVKIKKQLDSYKVTEFPYHWMTQDPGTQWTSSFHPKPRTFEKMYGRYYTPVPVPDKIKTLLMCISRNKLHKDIYSMYISPLSDYYSDDIVASFGIIIERHAPNDISLVLAGYEYHHYDAMDVRIIPL